MDKLLKLSEKDDIDELELAWMEEAEKDEVDWPGMLTAARTIAKNSGSETAESLLLYLIDALAERENRYEALKCAEQTGNILPDSERLRKEHAELYGTVHREKPWHEKIVGATLNNSSLNFQEATETLRKLELFPPGSYVRIDPGAKIGRVEDIAGENGLRIDIGGRNQTFPVEALENLHPLPADDIRPLAVYETERIEKLAAENPLQLIRLVLNSFGGRTDKNRMRRYLQKAIGKNKWNSWWKKTLKQIEKSPDIGVTAGNNPQFYLRAEPVSRAKELRAEFERTHGTDRLEMALKIGNEVDAGSEGGESLLGHISESLMTMGRENAEGNPELAAGALAVAWKLGDIGDITEGMAERLQHRPEWLEEPDWPRMLKERLEDSPYLTDILRYLPQWLPDEWEDIFPEVLPFMPPGECEEIVARLRSIHGADAEISAVNTITQCRNARLGSLLWVWRRYTKAPEEVEKKTDASGLVLLRRVLSAAASEGKARADRSRASRLSVDALVGAFSGQGEEAVETAAGGAEDEEIRALINLAERNPGLDELTRSRITRAVRAARPDLFRISTPPWEENVIYTSGRGLQRQKNLYNELVNEKIPEIVRQVGEAAEFGDLSENAEYTAALEERERLSRKAGEIKKSLRRARVIPPEMPQVEHVTIGSRVKALNLESKAEEALVFLGPWDADPSAGIYAYNSPLALAFMGAKKGDEVGYETEKRRRRWKVLEVEPAGEYL